MQVKKITPVLFVQDVEPCVKFWMGRFGFEKIAEVPDGDKLAFAMLQKGNVELMYQSYASAARPAAVVEKTLRSGPAAGSSLRALRINPSRASFSSE